MSGNLKLARVEVNGRYSAFEINGIPTDTDGYIQALEQVIKMLSAELLTPTSQSLPTDSGNSLKGQQATPLEQEVEGRLPSKGQP